MLPKLASLAAASCLLAGAIAQRTLDYDIPSEEAVTFANDDGLVTAASGSDDESPAYNLIYRVALPIPPVKQPKQIITNPVTGNPIWYYEIEEKLFQQRVFPNLQAATLVGYDGISPGPTIVVPQGIESVVRFVNNAQRETSVHLHGSPSRAPFDGWAADITRPGEYKDYYYPNYESARTLWYHDHALGITAENAFFGLAGMYLVTDSREDALGLPSGYGQFDIPLVLASKVYNQNGTLQSQLQEDTSTWGDIIHVNGQPWPFLNVQPRKYRFRVLNTGISRNYDLYFARSTALNTKLNFQVIATDAGLTDVPVTTQTLVIGVAERYEVVFDFSQFAGQQIELRNLEKVGGFGVDEDYDNTDKVMRFNVAAGTVADPSRVPNQLRAVPFPPQTTGIDHHFEFHRQNGMWLINGVGFEDAANRVLAKVPRGTVEIWELENGSGGWTHPIHVHLVDFRVISRTGGRGRGVEPYESHGLKDVVWLATGETVRVEAHYQPWNGLYMFHCHNLIHEDHDMMAAFNVTKLRNFGYNETTDFGDPEDARWAAQPFNQADFRAGTGIFSAASVQSKVELLARQQPYSELDEVTAALDAFWAGKDIGNPNAANKKREALPSGQVPRYRRFVV